MEEIIKVVRDLRRLNNDLRIEISLWRTFVIVILVVWAILDAVIWAKLCGII